jgi:hypothetical protein
VYSCIYRKLNRTDLLIPGAMVWGATAKGHTKLRTKEFDRLLPGTSVKRDFCRLGKRTSKRVNDIDKNPTGKSDFRKF